MSEMATGTSSDAAAGVRADARFAWLTLFFAASIIGGLVLLSYALDNELTHDVVVSPYHVPFYVALIVLATVSLVLLVRTLRAGRSWRDALPPGYGIVGAGLIVLLVWPIADIAWREGVGLSDAFPERILAPSRLLVVAGTLLIAAAPLRAALAWRAKPLRWPAVGSATLVLVVLSSFGSLPATNTWLEKAPNEPGDEAEIWVMNGDGTMQTRLIEADDGYEYGSPTWSPDGSQISYTRWLTPDRVGIPALDMAIWVASADGTDRRLVIEGTGWYWLPHWSPDGQWILFTIDAQRGVGTGAGVAPPDVGFGQAPAAGQPAAVAPNIDVWRIRADGTGVPERVTSDPAEDRAGVYSPDGQHIVFDSTRDEGRTAIYVMDADGSNAVRQTFFGDDWGATWSPSGDRIAFHAHPNGVAGDIYVVDFPVVGPPIQLTDDPDAEFVPAFSPDGSQIAFNTVRQNEPDIWGMNADGTGQANLTRTIGVDENLAPGGGSWGPDGRIIYQRVPTRTVAENTSFLRDALGATSTLLGALVLAFLVLLVVVVGAPFGAVALMLGLATGISALGSGDWRFVPAAVVAGLLVDVLIRLASDRRKPLVGAAAVSAVSVLVAGVTVGFTTGLGWTPSLLIGVALASSLFAWGMAAFIRRTWPAESNPPAPGATI
jgi:TolB protein